MDSGKDRMRNADKRRAFSLIELLVVMVVIAILVAILVPTLGGARNTARAASTKAQLTDLANASQQFITDKGRQPGYFSARLMGDTANENRGFTAMQNVMLDLAGGIVTTSGAGTVEVGPTTSDTVRVDLTLIGTREAGGGYYTPDATRFIAQTGEGAGTLVGNSDHQALPSVVDAFGTPILAWQRDRTAIQPIEAEADFVKVNTSGTTPARFYWASNAGLLKTGTLGKRGKTALFTTATQEHSLLGDGATSLINNLVVLLGSPTVPGSRPNLPSAARADLLFHSAGIDALYMGSRDIGGRSGQVQFWQNFYADAGGSQRLIDGQGRVETVDVLSRFDDLIQTAGN